MDAFVKFYGARKPQDAAGVFFQMARRLREGEEVRRARQAPRGVPQEVGRQGRSRPQVLAHFRLGEIAWKASCPKAGENGACIEVKRVAATGRQKVLARPEQEAQEGQEDQRGEGTQCGPPTSSKIVLFDRNKQHAAKGAGALRRPCSRSGTRARRPRRSPARTSRRARAWRPTRSPARPSTWPRRSTRTSSASKFPEGLDFQQPSQYDTKKKAEAKKKKSEESVKKFSGLPRREVEGAAARRAQKVPTTSSR